MGILRWWRQPKPLEDPAAPACDGCDERAPLTPFTNGHSYCSRCAEEVRALGWATPVSMHRCEKQEAGS